MHELSVWEKESFFEQQDLIIIGSGFAGLWSALHYKLQYPYAKLTILERGLVPTGASTRNAGFSCFGSPSEIIHDAGIMGRNEMWKLVQMRFEGLQLIRNFFTDDEIDYLSNGGYECFTPQSEEWATCVKNLNWINEGLQGITGEPTVFTMADEKIASFGFTGFGHLIENKLEGNLNPAKLVKALLKKVQALGVQVFTGIEVLNYIENDNLVQVIINQPFSLVARQLLICTNAYSKQLIPSIDIIPNRGQVLVTSPIKSLRLKGNFHFDRGFYYFRNLGNRLLIGGARNIAFEAENTTLLETTEAIQGELEQFAQKYLLRDSSFVVAERWSGIMAMGSHKSPIVAAVGKNVYCCVRMSGMGVAISPLVALKAVHLMNEKIIV